MSGASAAGLSASSAGTDPGFTNAASKNFTLAAGSGAMGKAATAPDLPDSEYYRDEQVTRQSRMRASAKDLGAFESTTTSVPTGPYGAPPATRLDGSVDAPPAIDAGKAGTGGTAGMGGVAGTGGRGGAGGAGGATALPDASLTSGGGATGTGGATERGAPGG